ncbi:Zinc-type alcohol dehydrogenase-like protein YogA [Collariella sp. IMI 366227]|nr:Zinc-type alcohol dehydrogenase-like protein YogA [Collariella sp. IMI 366227]
MPYSLTCTTPFNSTPPPPHPGPSQLLIKLSAAALNHRDLFIRQHLYPGISFTHPLLADGYGTGWEKELTGMLPKDRPYLDAVVDGAGGEVVGKTVRLLKPGGVISCYGMTVGPKMDWVMQATLKQIELRGSTMGSKAEFKAMVDFVNEHKIRPVVSRVVKGLDNLEGINSLFEDMKAGRQFGKLVIQIDAEGDSAKL